MPPLDILILMKVLKLHSYHFFILARKLNTLLMKTLLHIGTRLFMPSTDLSVYKEVTLLASLKFQFVYSYSPFMLLLTHTAFPLEPISFTSFGSSPKTKACVTSPLSPALRPLSYLSMYLTLSSK